MSEIVLALDFADKDKAIALARTVKQEINWIKIGLELFCSQGPAIIYALKELGFKIFLDLKFFDIPNTVKKTVKTILQAKVDMFTVHVLGGQEMLTSVVAIKNEIYPQAIALGVTILTSFNQEDLFWSKMPINQLVFNLAQIGHNSGLDGLVLSPLELKNIRAKFSRLVLVTPGIRLASKNQHDQKRIATPSFACKQGADYLVIGREITLAKEPLKIIAQIKNQISEVKNG